MSDQTAARDRAIEHIRMDLREGLRVGNLAVADLLGAYDELRALAGAPTADVAEDVEPPVYWSPTTGLLQGSATGFGLVRMEGFESIRDLPSDAVRLSAAPEGTPTADVAEAAQALVDALHEDERHQLGMGDDGEAEYSFTAAEREAIARITAAPEGVDAADELAAWPPLDEEEAEEARAEQRQRDAELTAAQAAIQRVREECEFATNSTRGWDLAVNVLRALDGDTTEKES